MRKKKVCLVTPNHIATNPRLIKEAVALFDAGYLVHLVFTQHVKEVVPEDLKILRQYPSWTYDYLDWTGADVKSKFVRLRNGVFYKIHQYIGKHLFLSSKILLNRNYFFQLKAALKSDADLFIAHNAGALAVAADAAKKLDKKFGFDAEDFHRGEILSSNIVTAVCQVEDHYLPQANYISAASPLIGLAYEKLYAVNTLLLNNVFPLDHRALEHAKPADAPLQLFWFSQSVGTNRGLQDIFAAMKKVESLCIEFHIYGKVYQDFLEQYECLLSALRFKKEPLVYFHGTISPDDLLLVASQYDIGLAIEPGFCQNNLIALSNKIFTYLLGGNAIIFSDTPAQANFYEQNPGIGFLYQPKDINRLATILDTYFYDRVLLHKHRNKSKELFESEFNWNKVQRLFLQKVKELLSDND